MSHPGQLIIVRAVIALVFDVIPDAVYALEHFVADVLVFRDDILLVAGYLDPPVAILQAVFLNGLVTRYLVRFIQQSAACFMLIYTVQ